MWIVVRILTIIAIAVATSWALWIVDTALDSLEKWSQREKSFQGTPGNDISSDPWDTWKGDSPL